MAIVLNFWEFELMCIWKLKQACIGHVWVAEWHACWYGTVDVNKDTKKQLSHTSIWLHLQPPYTTQTSNATTTGLSSNLPPHHAPCLKKRQTTSVFQLLNGKPKNSSQVRSYPNPMNLIGSTVHTTFTGTCIENVRAFPIIHGRVDGYPNPTEITRYRNLPPNTKPISKNSSNATAKLSSTLEWNMKLKPNTTSGRQHALTFYRTPTSESWRIPACLSFYKKDVYECTEPSAQSWLQWMQNF